MPIDSQDDGEDGSSSCKTSAKRQIALPECTEPGLTPSFVPFGSLVEIHALQRVRQFHPLHIDAEDRNKKCQMKDKVKYKRHSGEYTKVCDPGGNEARAKIKQGEVLKRNGKGKMSDFAQRVSDALMGRHLRGRLQDDINQTKSGGVSMVLHAGTRQLTYYPGQNKIQLRETRVGVYAPSLFQDMYRV
jgi:hypothetical protein